MAGASLYGSFRAGLTFGKVDGKSETFVDNVGSRWGIKGSHEVAEGLTVSYKYETHINLTNAESSGGVGHGHPVIAGSDAVDEIAGTSFHEFALDADTNTFTPEGGGDEISIDPVNYVAGTMLDSDDDGNAILRVMNEKTYATVTTPESEDGQTPESRVYYEVASSRTTHGHDVVAAGAETKAIEDDGGPGGRLSYVSLSGGFGTVSLGQIWAASGNHYGAAIYPAAATYNGSYGGSSGRQGNTVSYSSSAGDVSFQIDKVTGDNEKLDFGASANLGPVGVGFGYWSNANDDASFTGVAISAGTAGVDLTIGLGNEKNDMGVSSGTNNITIGGALGDTGVSYGVQVLNADDDADDTNYLFLKNSLGTGASLIFEHVDPSTGDSTTTLALRVDF